MAPIDPQSDTKRIFTADFLAQFVERLGPIFTVLDVVEAMKHDFPEEWDFLVHKYGLFGSGTKYSAQTYLSNRLSVYSRSPHQQVLLPTPTGWNPVESRFLRRTTPQEREHFGSSWIVIFNKA